MVKRAKVGGSDSQGTQRRSRNAGKLKCLFDIPVEVFFEIVSQLTPLDLLQLSRVSKSFRSEFMSRRSKHVWVAARRNNFPELPECPQQLAEPKYANLLFEHNCMACGAKSAKMVDSGLYRRYCKGCYNLNTQKGSSLIKFWGKKVDTIVYTLLHCSSAQGWLFGSRDSLSNNAKDRYCRVEFGQVIPRYLSLLCNENERLMYIRERQKQVREDWEHSLAIARWDIKARHARSVKESGNERKRVESIERKLKELGYKEESWPRWAERDAYCQWNRLLNQPRELTTRIWNSISPKLVSIIEGVAQGREQETIGRRLEARKREIAPIYEHLLHTLDDDVAALMPCFVDVCKLQCVKRLLEEEQGITPVTKDRWSPIEADFLNEVQKFEIDIKKSYLRSARVVRFGGVDNPDEEIDDSFFSNPRALFGCHHLHCRELLRFPEIRLHCHVQTLMKSLNPPLETGVYPDELIDIALQVLKTLGMAEDSPQSALDSLNGRLECLCGNPGLVQPMSFGALVRHIYDENRWYQRVQISRNGKPETLETQITFFNDHDLTDENPFFTLRDDVTEGPVACIQTWGVWSCKLCPDHHFSRRTKEAVEHHMLTKHLKDVEESDTHLYPMV